MMGERDYGAMAQWARGKAGGHSDNTVERAVEALLTRLACGEDVILPAADSGFTWMMRPSVAPTAPPAIAKPVAGDEYANVHLIGEAPPAIATGPSEAVFKAAMDYGLVALKYRGDPYPSAWLTKRRDKALDRLTRAALIAAEAGE